MKDLIYGGNAFRKDIEELFPDCKITDASDDVHNDRIEINVELERKEYYRRIILNGFGEMSLGVMLIPGQIISSWTKEWEEKYPEYFKDSSHE